MPKETRIFTIESQSKYRISVDEIENIEDAGDDFVTEDELNEMGVTSYYSATYLMSNIKEALLEVKASIKDGKKSAIIKDEELLETLKNSHYYSCSDFLDNTRRVGNRMFYYPEGVTPQQTKPKFANWKELVWMCRGLVNLAYGTDIDIRVNSSNRVKTIDMYKKLLEWEVLEKEFTGKGNSCSSTPDEIKWMKQMWEDSETIPVVSSN